MPTQDRLRELLRYDQHSGMFTWKVDRGGTAKAGSPAGRLDTKGYLQIGVDGRRYKAQLLAWLYVYGVVQPWLDHKNGIPCDDRINNLREATRSQNMANKKVIRRGLKGATSQPGGRWQARIRKDGQSIHLGIFQTEAEAHAAYIGAARAIYGEFARAA